MRIAFIAGFLPPAHSQLEEHFKSLADEHSLFVVPLDSRRQIDLRQFKVDFLDQVAQGATDILVCAHVHRREEHVLRNIKAILESGRTRQHELQFKLETFPNARDAEGVSKLIREFGPTRDRQFSHDLAQFEPWVVAQHAKRILLHSRAARSVKKSRFADVPAIFSAVDLLGREYWESKAADRGQTIKKYELLTARLNTLGLELGPSISESRAGEQGLDYFVKYPEESVHNRFLDLHLKKGVSYDERYCLRIYFFWCEDSRRVVIGWLTSHLDTRAS
jgi:hypothetical protein